MKSLRASLQQNFIVFSKSPAAIIVAILPFLLLFSIGSIIPVAWILPQVITLSIISISFLSIGVQYNEYRKTRFFKTNKTTQIKTSTIILGTFIVTFVVSIAIIFTLLILTWFFTQAIPILSQTADNVRIPGFENIQAKLKDEAIFSTFNISNINWVEFIYSILISIIMTSLFAILIGNIIPSFKAYTLFTMFYLVVFILLSGLTIPKQLINDNETVRIISEIIPNINTSNLIETSMHTNISTQVEPYTKYLNGMRDFFQNVLDEKEEFDYNTLQEYISGGIDPFDLSFLINTYPMISTLIIDSIQIINNLFGTSYLLDSSSFFFFVADVVWYVSPDDVFIFVIENYIVFLTNLSNAFNEIFNVPNSFGANIYGLKTNLIPILIIFISLPSFIKVVSS